MLNTSSGIRIGTAGMFVWILWAWGCDQSEFPPNKVDDDVFETDSADIGISTDSGTGSHEDPSTSSMDSETLGDQDTDPEVETEESIEEPPLPPPLSHFYALQAKAMKERRATCGLVGLKDVSVPEGLVEHLTTQDEYARHKECLTALGALRCDSPGISRGDLAAVSGCLYHQPKIHDALEPPAQCPATVDDLTFDARRERFSLHNAYHLLDLSILSKLNKSSAATAALAPLGYLEASIIINKRIQVLYAEHEAHVVIAFKGTTEFSDYFSNATYIMVDSAKTGFPGKIHKGFHDTLSSGWAGLSTLIDKAFATGKSVVFTGHSLGGALAQLCAFKSYRDKGLVVRTLYMFATPRVGDQAYADAYVSALGDRSFRVNNGLDITPHMPPAAGAEHVAKEALLSLFGEGGWGIDFLSGFLDLVLGPADYAQVGDELWIDPQGYLYGLLKDDVAADIDYWLSASALFKDKSFAEITAALPKLHDDRTHLCYHARLIEELLYERD